MNVFKNELQRKVAVTILGYTEWMHQYILEHPEDKDIDKYKIIANEMEVLYEHIRNVDNELYVDILSRQLYHVK